MVSVPKVKSSLFPQCTWRSTSPPSILSEDVYPIQASCASLEQHWFPMALAFPRHGGTVWKADCAEDKRKPLIENHPAVKARILLDGSSKITMIKIITLLNSVSVSCYKFLYTMTLHDSSRSHLVFHRSQTLQKLIIGQLSIGWPLNGGVVPFNEGFWSWSLFQRRETGKAPRDKLCVTGAKEG